MQNKVSMQNKVLKFELLLLDMSILYFEQHAIYSF